tara:strand:+ start:2315 stop:2521 length:207 start_codon:yes stop_codon:yes gene_type:complete
MTPKTKDKKKRSISHLYLLLISPVEIIMLIGIKKGKINGILMLNNGTEQTATKRPKNKREIITQVTFL